MSSVEIHNPQVEELQSPLRDGWGICSDGASLIVSDSSPTLSWLDPDTLQQQRTAEVHDGDATVPWVNEVSGIRCHCNTGPQL
jgi:glutaminyl-peptide cyclotransferase